jgi:hypothetical protein
MCLSVAGANASAQTAPLPAVTRAPAASGTPAWCPLSVRVRDVDDTHTRYAVSFRAFTSGTASGIVALWAGDRRYDVPFHNVVALDSRDRISPETSITVRFAAPVSLDGAVVTAVGEGASLLPCDPWYAPWIPGARSGPDLRTPEQRGTEDRFLARARAAAAIDAPAAVADPRPCTTPDRPARTVFATRPDTPQFAGGGLSVVMVVLDPADKIVSARVERSSGDGRLDAAALGAARGSEFQGQIFRCRHIMGGYSFSVEFGPT